MVCTMIWRPRDANTVVFCSDLRVEACTHHCFHCDFEHSGLLILGPKASRPIFSNLGPLSILTEILHILVMTFANSLAQGLPAYFSQSGVPPNPYWNITHSLYHICQFLGPMPPARPIFLNLGTLQILTKILHLFCMTFANSWAQGLPAHFAHFHT